MSDDSDVEASGTWFNQVYGPLIEDADGQMRRRTRPPVLCPTCRLLIIPQYHSIVRCNNCQKFRRPRDRATADQVNDRWHSTTIRQCECDDWCSCPVRTHDRIDYGLHVPDDAASSDDSYDPTAAENIATSTTPPPVLAVGSFFTFRGARADNQQYLHETINHHRTATEQRGSPDSGGEDDAPHNAVDPAEVLRLRRGISTREYMDLLGQGIPESYIRSHFDEMNEVGERTLGRVEIIPAVECPSCHRSRTLVIQEATEAGKVLVCDHCELPRFSFVTSMNIYEVYGHDTCFCHCKCDKDKSSSSEEQPSMDLAPIYLPFRPRSTLGTAAPWAQPLLIQLGYCERNFEAERHRLPYRPPSLDEIIQQHYPHLEPSAQEMRQLELTNAGKFPNEVAQSHATSSGLPLLLHRKFLDADVDVFGDKTQEFYRPGNETAQQSANDNPKIMARLQRFQIWQEEHDNCYADATRNNDDENDPIWKRLDLIEWLNYYQDKYSDDDKDSYCSGHEQGLNRQAFISRILGQSDSREPASIVLYPHNFRHCTRRIERITKRGGCITDAETIKTLIESAEYVFSSLSGVEEKPLTGNTLNDNEDNHEDNDKDNHEENDEENDNDDDEDNDNDEEIEDADN